MSKALISRDQIIKALEEEEPSSKGQRKNIIDFTDGGKRAGVPIEEVLKVLEKITNGRKKKRKK